MEFPEGTRWLSRDQELAQVLRYCAAASANAHSTGPQPNVKVEIVGEPVNNGVPTREEIERQPAGV